ncbi:AI-2E family transporter [Tropicimonas sp. IMCC34043]|uniref:AI-2E family transporter n=1 Tax=Tropicimonas sp. IMCC34043 TaxID=2248760 RepID=UPI000E23938E|nr:AI-2E family transporter [Tropicimonas sp. IMCC34043]
MKSDQTAVRVAVILLAALATVAALRVAQGLLAPILLAFVVGVLLAPLTDRLAAAGVPPALAALSGLLATAAVAATFVLFLEPYVSDLVRRAPYLWREAQEVIENLRHLLRGVEQVADSVAEALDAGKDAAQTAGNEGSKVADALPDVGDAISYAPALAGQTMIFVGTLFFFLLGRGEAYGLLGELMPGVGNDRLFEAERLVSRYFLTIAMINVGLGVLVTLALTVVGMPNPVLWGVLACVINFVPYLGPVVYAAALAIGGVLVFDGILGLAPVACFMALNMIEGQFVTPTLVSRTLSINPLLVFLTLTAWLWLWGAVGGVVALPLLVWVLALTERPAVSPQKYFA